jgi:hypothetical protein
LALLNAAALSFVLGEWSDTRAAITELGQRELSMDQRAYLAGKEAMLAALTGNPEEASTCLEPHADRLAASESVTVRATYLMDQALMDLATGDIEAARRKSTEARLADR